MEVDTMTGIKKVLKMIGIGVESYLFVLLINLCILGFAIVVLGAIYYALGYILQALNVA